MALRGQQGAAALLMGSGAGAVDLTTDLVGHWGGNNTEAGGEWSDLTGSGQHAALGGSASITTDGLNLTGDGDHATVSHTSALNITGDLTICCWLYYTGGSGLDDPEIVQKRVDDNDRPYEFRIGDNYNTGLVLLDDGNKSTSTTDYPTNYSNGWHHVAVVRSGTSVTFYVDGSSDGGGTISGTISGNTADLEIGDRPGETNWYMTGKIDDLRIYDAAKSESFIGSVITDSAYTHN